MKKISALVIIRGVLAGVLMLAATRAWLRHGVAVEFSADSKHPATIRIEGVVKESPETKGSTEKASIRIRRGRSSNRILLEGSHVGASCIRFIGAVKQLRLSALRIVGKETLALNWRDFSDIRDVDVKYTADEASVVLNSQVGGARLFCGKPLVVEASWFVDWVRFVACMAVSWIVACALTAFCGRFRRLWRASDSIQKDGHIVSFDVVRIMAMLMVVIGHCAIILGFCKPGNALRECASFGVTLFILISAVSLSMRSFGGSWRDFFAKRVLAILPPFWVAYFVCAMILFAINGRVSIDGQYPFHAFITLCGLDGFLYSQYASPYYRIGEWFVGFVLILYVVAPFLHKAVCRQPFVTLVFCGLISYLSIIYTPTLAGWCPLWNHSPGFNPASRLFEFACGLLFYRYIRPDFKRYTCCAAFGALLVAVYLTISPKSMFLFSFGNMILQLALALCILYVLDLIKYEGCVMEVLTFLSSLSFLVFLYHKRVIYLFADCFGKKVMANEVFIHFVLLALLGCYILAYLSVKPVAVVRKLFSKCISGDNAK